jgi:type I restriction enzyme R subunit
MAANGGPLERDTIRDLVLPAVADAGWTEGQIVREFPLKARRVVSLGGVIRDIDDGFADIALEAHPGTPVAVIEAKRRYKTAADAIQQAIRYAQQLEAPLAYGANGTEIIERNLRTGSERNVSALAAPALAWSEYCAFHGLDDEGADLVAQPTNRNRLSVSGDVVEPRWYQTTAINSVLRAIARGKRRVLLLMATGTGKTFTAMQIVAKLRSYEHLVHPDRNYRVLYLADRDLLLNQPMRKDFAPAFGNGLLRRVLGRPDASGEAYFASYQAMTGANPDAPVALGSEAPIFTAFRPDFFDLVIVDECHRGSAEANSSWRRVLDHFTSAVQLGLTATPRDDKVNSYEYFGNPVFRYTLRQGIEDGYLAPYKVRRVVLSPDAEGWQPSAGEIDRYQREIPEGTYTTRDFERVVSLLARTRLAAHHLSQTLRRDPAARAIVFCVDTEHASDMRAALIAENPDLVRDDPEWVVRIVGVEGEKDRLLDDFTDPTRISPVVATTSRLLSTGIDVEDLKYVVLFRPVGSMIEFKQIIGRGSRLYPEKGKTFFEIIDYVGATRMFADPDFDGFPVDIRVETVDGDGEVAGITDPDADEPADPEVSEPEPPFTTTNPSDPSQPPPLDPPAIRRKYYVDGGDFAVEAEARLVPTRTPTGWALTEYGQMVRDRIRLVDDAAGLRRRWSVPSSRHQLAASLEAQGVDLDELLEAVGIPGVDPLDALFHLAWNLPIRTRAERARRVREDHAAELAQMSRRARDVLEGLLHRYEIFGVADIEDPKVFHLDPLSRLGSPSELARELGGADHLRAQLDRVQEWLYA